jgi:hypothetical protein
MAQGKKTRRGKAAPKDEGPVMVDLMSGILYVQEALHMAHFLMNAVEGELGEHPAVKDRPEWVALTETAREALFRLYQNLGAESYYIRHPEERTRHDQKPHSDPGHDLDAGDGH